MSHAYQKHFDVLWRSYLSQNFSENTSRSLFPWAVGNSMVLLLRDLICLLLTADSEPFHLKGSLGSLKDWKDKWTVLRALWRRRPERRWPSWPLGICKEEWLKLGHALQPGQRSGQECGQCWWLQVGLGGSMSLLSPSWMSRRSGQPSSESLGSLLISEMSWKKNVTFIFLLPPKHCIII